MKSKDEESRSRKAKSCFNLFVGFFQSNPKN